MKGASQLTESGRLSVLEDHVLNVLFVVETHTGEDLEGRRGDTTLVGARVLVKDNTSLLKPESSLLGEEQVGAFDDVLEMGLAVGVDELGNVGNVDGFGTTTTGNKEVGLDAEVEVVSEFSTIGDDFTAWQLVVLVLDKNLVSLGAKLGLVEVRNWLSGLGETNKLRSIQSMGIVQDTGTVDNGDSLVLGQQDLVGSEISIGTTGLEFGDILLSETVSLEYTVDVLSDRERGHTVSVVRDTAKGFGRFTSGERLPPRRRPSTSVVSSPVHELGSVLVGTKEENLGILSARNVNDGPLNTRASSWKQKVDDRVDVLLEALGIVGIESWENGTLGTTLRDILVLQVLSRGQGIVLIEESSDVGVVVLLASGSNDTNTTTRDVSESDVETSEVRADDEEHAEGLLGVLDVRQERGV